MSETYEVVIYTASKSEYAYKAIALLDPERKYVSEILCQEYCTNIKSLYIKDLSIFTQNTSLDNILIVDNLINSFAFQLGNGIPIKPYMEGKEDTELEELCTVLERIPSEGKVQTFMDKTLRLNKFYAFCLNFPV